MNHNVFKTTERFGNIRADSCGSARFVQETGPTERTVSRRKATTLKKKNPRHLEPVAPSVDGIPCRPLGRLRE